MVQFIYVGTGLLINDKPEPDLRVSLASGKVIHDLSLGSSGRSPIIEYYGPETITLFRKVKVKDKMEQRKVGSVDIPNHWRGVLFLVTYAPELAPFPFQFTPVEFWGETIPEKHVRFHNFCPANLAVQLAGGQSIVEAKKHADIDVSAAVDFLPIKIACLREEGWKMVVKTGLPKPRDSRTLIIAYPMTSEFNNISTLIIGNVPMPPPPPASK